KDRAIPLRSISEVVEPVHPASCSRYAEQVCAVFLLVERNENIGGRLSCDGASQVPREPFYRRIPHQVRKPKLLSGGFVKFSENAHQSERIHAGVEQARCSAKMLRSKRSAENLRDPCFEFIFENGKACAQRFRTIQCEGTQIDLAIGSQRNVVKEHVTSRHHV